jgi:hypothetical protein
MKTLLKFLFFFLISISSNSQTKFLPVYGDFKANGNGFTIKKVIDARKIKDLGLIEFQKGKLDTLVLNEKMGEFLTKFLETCNKKQKKSNALSLILKINEY